MVELQCGDVEWKQVGLTSVSMDSCASVNVLKIRGGASKSN